MKLQLTQHNETYTIESDDEDTFGEDMVEYMHNLLLAAGYHCNSVKEVFLDKADQLGAEEGWCMQPNPVSPVADTLSNNRCIEVKSRYGDSRYFYIKADYDKLIYEFYDVDNIGMSRNDDNSIHSVDPSGGPFICQGTNLYQDISNRLPNRVVDSISFDTSQNVFILDLKK